MDTFYAHVLVCGATQGACARIMEALGRRSFVAPAYRGIVPVCDAGSESLDVEMLDSIAYTLAHRLQVPAVALLNHDDDLLVLRIFDRRGFQGYCRSGMLIGGAYAGLKQAFAAACRVASLWFAFARPFHGEIERHSALAGLLDLPPWSVGMGYGHLAQGERPKAIGAEPLIRT